MNPKTKKALLTTGLIAVFGLIVLVIFNSPHYFTRRNIRLFQRDINSFGAFSPLSAMALIILSTVVPPLPLPVPLIEIASGLAFGFEEGAVLIWISQVVSSLIAFKAARFLNERFFAGLEAKWIKTYKDYIHQSGPWAVGITRATMAAPFNIISYLAGLTHMSTGDFLLSTGLGVIPESVLFAFVGSELRVVRFNLRYLSAGLVLLGIVGFLSSFTVIKILQSKRDLS